MFDVIEIPIRLPIKKTNCILILDQPITLVDPGVKAESTISLIHDALQAHGRGIQDVKRILLTHGHVDHFGAAVSIQKISGAEIFIHPHDENKILRTSRHDDEFTLKYKEVLSRHGCPEKGLSGIDDFWEYIKDMYDPIPNARFYSRDWIDFEQTRLRVLSTPGHTRGSVVFVHEESGILLGGDTVIEGITPNPIMEFLENGDRFASQSAFRKSIQTLSATPVKKVIGGHGKICEAPQALFQTYQEEWKKNEKKLLDLLNQFDSLNAYEALIHVFGELKNFQIFLGMSEIIGSLDYLVSLNQVEYFEEKGFIRARISRQN